MSKMLTVKAFAHKIGRTPSAVHWQIKQGNLEAVRRKGKVTKIPEDAVIKSKYDKEI